MRRNTVNGAFWSALRALKGTAANTNSICGYSYNIQGVAAGQFVVWRREGDKSRCRRNDLVVQLENGLKALLISDVTNLISLEENTDSSAPKSSEFRCTQKTQTKTCYLSHVMTAVNMSSPSSDGEFLPLDSVHPSNKVG
uniref:Uncharacterized protein n=1 Tax=Timema douglasi TaxID=61478 RepID=A0A7R8ZGW8_TIMDO|nr:unnamed protein product [Timema douglasi]